MTVASGFTTLPVPTGAQKAHLEAVRAHVVEIVGRAGGWLAFDDYLREVLYAPGIGYYSAGAVKLGADGDFVTAPELSDLFGRCLARQLAPILGSHGQLLELGAGSGALAAVLLPVLADAGWQGEYLILEVSADLRQRQEQRLAALEPSLQRRLRWLQQLPAEPLQGAVIANEVVDALPFKRAMLHDGQWWEQGVTLDRGQLQLALRPPTSTALMQELERVLAPKQRFRDGYVVELCVVLDAWIAGLSACLERGAVLIIDYGEDRGAYYRPERVNGTLRCYYRHRRHEDALLYPGIQDITASVDFTRVAEAASDCGLEVAGYCTQEAFLLATGIASDVAAVTSATNEQVRLAAQARQLISPGEMGAAFKVMGLTRGLHEPLLGFSLQDIRHRL